ncbi:MAG: hypothetical protein VXY06_00095 [Bacteroidota bacterium]|nr:hypothetical protein [Bacteroidota bacterium]
MKNQLFVICIVVITFSCSGNYKAVLDARADTTPTDEACLTYFERRFYDSEGNVCEQIAYSGYSERCFESLEACQDCLYN